MRSTGPEKENVKVGSSILFSQCNAEVLAAILPGARPLYRPSMRNKIPRSKRSIMKTIKHSYNLCPSHLFVFPPFFTCYCWMQLYVTYCLSRNTRPKFWRCWIPEVWRIRTGRITVSTGNTEMLNGDVYRCARLTGQDCPFLQKRDWEDETDRETRRKNFEDKREEGREIKA